MDEEMQPVAAQRTLCRSVGVYTMGPKFGATSLEAGLLILILDSETETGAIQYGQQTYIRDNV